MFVLIDSSGHGPTDTDIFKQGMPQVIAKIEITVGGIAILVKGSLEAGVSV